MIAAPASTLAHIAQRLRELRKPFALVGGLAVSVRAEVRFTRDVDLAVAAADDAEVEALVRDLAVSGYRAAVLVEHDRRQRLATVRLDSPGGIAVDLITATCGIESEIVQRGGNRGLRSPRLTARA
jgi:hypothetical protein